MQCNRNVVERNPETKNSPLALIPNTRMGKNKETTNTSDQEENRKEDKAMMKSSSHSSHHVQTGSHAYTDTLA